MRLKILLALTTLTSIALAAESGLELFQRAVTQERAGKMEDAIKLYEKVAHDFASDRALAAKALLHAAIGYEKQGQDKAAKVYEELATKYSDQREAATARTKLVALRQRDQLVVPPTMTLRKIELPESAGRNNVITGTDGQRAVYVDSAGDIVISDLTGKNKRVLYKAAGGTLQVGRVSRDLSLVYAALQKPDGSAPRLFITGEGKGSREIPIGRPEGTRRTCLGGWSWDNRLSFQCQQSPDGTARIEVLPMPLDPAPGLGGTVPASPRVVFSKANTTIVQASFSPDGRFIAFTEQFAEGRTFIMPSQGGDPVLVSESATLLDWTRDGRYLAVASTHSGLSTLYLLPVRDGKPNGDAIFVRYGAFTAFGNTAVALTQPNGALLYAALSQGATPFPAWIADLDPDGRVSAWKSLNLTTNGGSVVPNPKWSPDGTQFVYTAASEDTGQVGVGVRVRDVATGKEKELYRGAGIMLCTWAALRPNVFCSEGRGGGTTDILSIAADSGRVEKLGTIQGDGFLNPTPTPDDQALYLIRHPEGALVRWDIMTHVETVLVRRDDTSPSGPEPSWDGKWLGRVNRATHNIEIRPISAGDWKALAPAGAGQKGFSRDGKWIFYHGVDAAGKDGLYRIAITGGAPERLGDFPTSQTSGVLTVSSDGKRIVTLSNESGRSGQLEWWLLENFEPKAQAAR
jgi:Tol biopolymer transport system component